MPTNLNELNIDKIMRNSLTDDCLDFLNILNKNGFESFAVGGCVRDCILGNTPKDEDLTTNATPEQVRKTFSKLKGFSVWDSGLKHGTVTVVKGNTAIEITTYRSDGDYTDGRRPDSVKFEDSIDKDLARRDFTMNALAWSPRDGFKDNYHGLEDLQNGIIRTVGNANERISEDALRTMRAVRFSAKYGFEIDSELVNAIKNNSESLANVSAERIRDELCKTLMTDNPMYVKKFHELGLMKEISPEIDNLFNCEQNSKYHIYDVGNHTIKTLENSPKDLNIRVALLLHDVGKPVMKIVNEKTGQDQFLGHADASEIIASNILKKLKFTSNEVKDISNIVKYHDALIDLPNDNKKVHAKLRDFMIDHLELDDNFYKSFITVKACDIAGQNLDNPIIREKAELLKIMEDELQSIIENPHTSRDLSIDGHDMMKVSKESKNGNIFYCKGPAIREMQKILLREVIDDPNNNTKDCLMELCNKNVIQANVNIENSKMKKITEFNSLSKVEEKVSKYIKQFEQISVENESKQEKQIEEISL